jgi:hypothetical protein
MKPMFKRFLKSSALSVGSLLVSANYLFAQAQGYWSCYSRNPDTGVSSLSRTGSTEEIARQRLRDEVCQYSASSCDPFRPAICEFVPLGIPNSQPQPPRTQPHREPVPLLIKGSLVGIPSIAASGIELWAFARDGDGRILYTSSDPEFNWTDWREVPGNGRTSFVPAVTIWNGRPVVIIRGSGGDGRIYINRYGENGWNPTWNEVPGNGLTGDAPAVTVFQNQLVVLIRGQGDDERIYITKTDANWNWNTVWNELPGNGRTSVAPAITVFNNRLVAVIRGSMGDGQIYISQSDESWAWNPTWSVVPGDGRTGTFPAITVFNDRLVVLIRGQRDDGRIYITQTDANWNWNTGWNEVPGNGRIGASPSVTVLSARNSTPRLVSLIRGQDSDERIYITQTDTNWNWNSSWNAVPNFRR